MKSLVETTGEFQLYDPTNGHLIPHDRPSILPEDTSFTQAQFGQGQLRLVAHVGDAATDAEFLKYWQESKGDQALAVESFCSSFDQGSETVKPKKKSKEQ